MAKERRQAVELAALLASRELALRAERKSSQTIKSYGDAMRRFLAYCDRAGIPPVLDRPTVTGFVADLRDSGAEADTARSRQLEVRRCPLGSPMKANTTPTRCSG